jgi:hypothetical protein
MMRGWGVTVGFCGAIFDVDGFEAAPGRQREVMAEKPATRRLRRTARRLGHGNE